MRRMRSVSLLPAALTAVAALAAPARAGTLVITSEPAGATVELDGVAVGQTPLELNYPGSYFKKPHFVFTARLEHSMVARITKEGFLPKQIQLTEGPFNYVTFNGRSHGEYFLLKTDHVHVVLDPIGAVAEDSADLSSVTVEAAPAPELSLEEVVRRSSPAVVLLRGRHGHGSGFFLTQAGLIATNRHVVENEPEVTVALQRGVELPARVLFVDPDLDMALLKVNGTGFPHLPLAGVSRVERGQTVIGIGYPSGGMPTSVTRGIVSAIGPNAEFGPGIWIQTDASVNPGNSGGPLLNSAGQVIGIITRKEFSEQSSSGRPLSGIGYALSASDLVASIRKLSPTPAMPSEAALDVTSDPPGAEIYLDGKFAGSTPSLLRVSPGEHVVEIRLAGREPWKRELAIATGSRIALHAALVPIP